MANKRSSKSWWGDAWLEVLENIFWNHLNADARKVLKKDGVTNVEINGSVVSANVKGIYKKMYNTSIGFYEFSEDEKNIILETINENSLILSQLLNHELPMELYYKLTEKNISVFPFYFPENSSQCDCFEMDEFCVHKVAILQYLASEIDNDPFLLFKLQGCDLLKLIGFHDEVNEIKNIDDLFNIPDNEDVSGVVDFSKIPDLSEEILFLLNDNPIFFKKDFKSILKRIYNNLQKYANKSIESYTRKDKEFIYNSFVNLDIEQEDFSGDSEDYTQWLDDVFLKRWDMPNSWSQFKINLDKNYEISNIENTNKSHIENERSFEYLVNFFVELSESQITKFNKDIQFLNKIFHFSLELIKKRAFIPQLFETDDIFNIRWIPAVFDKNISEIIDLLALECSDDLIKVSNKKISKKSQVIACVSLFIQGIITLYMENKANAPLRKLFDEDIFKLFFFNGITSKDNFSTADVVNQWISKFNFNDNLYDLYFVIKDDYDSFLLDICVNDKLDSIRDVINNTDDINLKIQLLKQLYLIIEIFPDFKKSFEEDEDIVLDINQFSEFFLNTLPLFKIMGIKVILPKSLKNQFKPKIILNIHSNSENPSYMSFKDIVTFDWKVQVAENNYDLDEFKEIAKDSHGFVKFNNYYVMLDKKEIRSLITQIDKLPKRLNEHELLQSMLAQEYNQAEVNMDDNLKEMICELKKSSQITVPKSLHANLRQYQHVAFSWLVQNIEFGFGSILADDMGLGKTLEVLTTIQYFKDNGLLKNDKVLVVAPVGLLTNWQKEIEKFTPNLTSFIYHGNNRKFPDDEYDIYLTSYAIARKDLRKFNKKDWFLLIVDEAQNIKNPQAKQTKAIKSIDSKHKIAMSGTPVENRLSDYWSIFDFVNKGYLNTLLKFKKKYILPIERNENISVLNNFKKITSPFILRRVKSDKNIIQDLPDKRVNNVYCNMSQQQIGLYKETLDDAMEQIELNDGIQRKGLVLKLISSLKQICNHPSQFTKSKDYNVDESGKLKTLVSIVDNILEANEKVLIFTQYHQMGEIIKDTLQNTFSSKVLFLHGDVKRDLRDEMIEEFQTNSQIKIFVITLKTGGTGLNLTAANNVIHYDLWWNPAVENQATDRVYRIGQENNVMVYRFITSGTFEEKINDIITQKEDLANQTVSNDETFITEMKNDELKELMKLR